MRPVWVAQEYHYMPPVAETIRTAHAGAVGRMHQVAIREHREAVYPKVGDWNPFSTNSGGTLVGKCCHYGLAGGGAILNMGSVSWMRGRPNLAGCTTAKARIVTDRQTDTGIAQCSMMG